MKKVVGIDNGISGALVALSRTGDILWKEEMPSLFPLMGKNTKRRNEVHVERLAAILRREGIADTVIYMERPVGSQNASAAISMAGCFHTVRAVAQCLGIRFVRITPMEWQKELLVTQGPGDTKQAAFRAATRIWPRTDWRKKRPRCVTPFDGFIDAALIAEYGRRLECGNLPRFARCAKK